MIEPSLVSGSGPYPVFRGPSPTCFEDFKILYEQGIKSILDLETNCTFFGDNSPLIAAINADAFNIRTYAHPLGEILPPSSLELLEATRFLINRTESIYVHCKSGVDRTGMVIAHYRMQSDNWPKEKAVAEMKEMGMHPWYFYWVWSLR